MIMNKGLYPEHTKYQLEEIKSNREEGKECEKATDKRKTMHGR